MEAPGLGDRAHPLSPAEQLRRRAAASAIALDGNERALIGVRREPIMALSSGARTSSCPCSARVVEGVFEAEAHRRRRCASS